LFRSGQRSEEHGTALPAGPRAIFTVPKKKRDF
jgi:hypothetical protein